MNEMKHTPGPLRVRQAPGNIKPPFFDVEQEGVPGCIARVFAGDNAEADAKLYAAAPDLLEALEDARKWLNGQPDRSNCKAHSLFALIENIDAALSRAAS